MQKMGSKLFYICSLACPCPLTRFFMPRRSHLNGWWGSNSEAVEDVESGVVEIEMGDLTELSRGNGMEVFDRQEGASIDEPFDPAIDHFRILSQYSPQKKLLIVSVIEAGGECDVARCTNAQVRMALLSDKVIKKHTSFASGPSPKFNETFAFKLDEEKLQTSVIRFRLYRKRVAKRSQLVGEAYLKGRKIGPHSIHLLKIRPPITTSAKKKADLLAIVENGDAIASRVTYEINEFIAPSPLKSAFNHSNPNSSSTSNNHSNGNASLMKKIARVNGVEVLIVLAYSDEQDSFRIGIEKLAKLDKLMESGGKPLDCYFQLIVRSDGVELCRHRTKTFNCAQNDVDLNEFVVVSASLREIHDITVIVGFFCLQGFLKKRTLLGWIRLGADEIESADAAEHWMTMVHEIGRPVERWHTLRRPKNLTL
ncbi:C2 domain-containing protein [Aphelenchoides bicaudatus]|nr:C2 domain-containing protein [Aphelenchoides bicaudatus]